MSINKIILKKIITIHSDASLYETIKKMKDNNIDEIIIVNTIAGHNIPVGVFNINLIPNIYIQEGYLNHNLKIDRFMTKEFIYMKEESNIHEIARKLRSTKQERVYILNNADEIIGNLSRKFLIKYLTKTLNDLTENYEYQNPTYNKRKLDKHFKTIAKNVNQTPVTRKN